MCSPCTPSPRRIASISPFSCRAFSVGLWCRTVTTFLKTHPGQRTLVGMWEGLRPTYIAARNKEVVRSGEWLQRDYELVKVFKIPDAEVAQLYRGDRNMDLQFNLFRKK